MTTIEEAARAGREADGQTWRDCPFGHDQPELRQAWCKARAAVIESQRAWLFRPGIAQAVIGWVLFLALIVALSALNQALFGIDIW